MKEHQLTIHVQKTTMDINISPIHIQRTVGDMIRLPRCKTISSRHIIYKRLWGIYIFLYFINSFGKSRHSSRKSSATHSYQCVQCFRESEQWYGCHVWDF